MFYNCVEYPYRSILPRYDVGGTLQLVGMTTFSTSYLRFEKFVSGCFCVLPIRGVYANAVHRRFPVAMIDVGHNQRLRSR